MGHAIDTTNGVSSYADSRAGADGKVDAWHRLGQTIGRTMTPDEALDAARMKGWNVRKIEHSQTVTAADGSSVEVAAPGQWTVLRDNPVTRVPEALGVVGDRWQPFQNEETTGLLYDITEQSGAHVETIGSLHGGRQTFVTMKMPSHMEFTSPRDGSKDITDLYLAVLNHHDGQGALRALISPVRVVCANTQRMAESAAVSTVSLRHTGSPTAKLQEVRDLLGITFAYQETFAAEMEGLIAKERDEAFVRGVLNDVFGVGKSETERTRNGRVERVSQVMELYRTSDTVAPFAGTAYGAYNAVTEYVDHFMPVMGKNDQDRKRALRTLSNPDAWAIKGKAFAALKAS